MIPNDPMLHKMNSEWKQPAQQTTNQYKYSVTSTSANSGKTGIGQENNNVVKPVKPVQLMGAEAEDEDVYSDAFFIFYFF